MVNVSHANGAPGGEKARALSPLVRVLLWDFARGSLAYDLAVALVLLLLLLVPGAFWGDPLWVSAGVTSLPARPTSSRSQP